MKNLIIIIAILIASCESMPTKSLAVYDGKNFEVIHLNFRTPPKGQYDGFYSHYAEVYFKGYEEYSSLLELIHVPDSCDTGYIIDVEAVNRPIIIKWYRQDAEGNDLYETFEIDQIKNDSTYVFGW